MMISTTLLRCGKAPAGFAIALVLLTGVAMPRASAAGAPPFLPERDVKVDYTLTVPNQPPHAYELSFSAESERVRIDDPVRRLWFVADLRTAHAALVVPAFHAVVAAPDLSNLTAILQTMKSARFTATGEATIAGRHCTRYDVVSTEVTGTACLTSDGVALSVAGKDAHGSAEVVATSVVEAPMPADLFTSPAGFATVKLPPSVLAALLAH